MAYLGYSNQFDLDDEGILRDSRDSPAAFLLDDDGIVQDDIGFYKPSLTGHWTDSGFGTDKRSSTSTLQHLDYQSHVSFDDDSHNYYLDESVNISDLEASRDELSLDHAPDKGGYDDDLHYHGERALTPPFLNDSHTSVDRLLDSRDEDSIQNDSSRGALNEEYFKQLRELGVLIDDEEDLTQKNSLAEFENIENEVSRHNLLNEDKDNNDAIGRFLRETPTDFSVTETNERDAPQQVGGGDFVRHNQFKDLEKKFDNLAELTFESDSRRQSDTLSTISSRTFPEISPEEALQIYTRKSTSTPPPQEDNDAASIDFENSQKNQGVNDEDEIFLINGGFVSSANIENYYKEFNQTSPHSPSDSRPFSQTSQYSSRPETPASRLGSVTPLSSVSATDLTQNISRSGADTPHTFPSVSRPESASSHISIVSEGPSVRPKIHKAIPSTPSLPQKAKSQPSLVEPKKTPVRSDKMPKRLLPKPTVPDTGQTFKVRSKSTPNVAKSRPVKPSHSPLSEPQNDDDEIRSVTSEKSSREITTKLKKEFERRKQATELVQQLQKDYDSLLSKYAQAELTIDHMRLGAKISLHSESPTPGQLTTGTMLTPAQQVQMISMGGSTSSRATVLSSPHSATLGRYSPMTEEATAEEDSVSTDLQSVRRSPALSASRNDLKQPVKVDSSTGGENGIANEETARNEAESVKNGLLREVEELHERVDSFKILVEENHLTTEEQENVFEKIRTDHEKLRRNYLQTKDDYNAIKRSGASKLQENFDENKELEGELFRLGMTFDEVQEQVEEKMKERSQRLPFKEKRKPTDENKLNNDKAIDHLKKKVYGTEGIEYRQARGELPFSADRYERLHGEYNEIVARTDELRSMTPTAERDREMNKLTKKLKRLNDEDPQNFRIPLELQNRELYTTQSSVWERLRTKSPWERRWERLQERELEENGGRYDRNSRIPGSANLRSLSSPNGGLNSSFNRETGNHGERSLHSSDLDSDHRRSGDVNGLQGRPVGLLPPRERRTKQDVRSSRERLANRLGGSNNSLNMSRELDSSLDFNDNGNGGSRVRRPNRHDFPERRDRDRGLKKKTESGSLSSLPDSGISDHETGLRSLNLPGPGKFKQMTSRKPTDDLDSGFIGSVVTSDVGQLPNRQSPSQQQQQQQQHQGQQQKPLRLRHPAEASSESSRLSDRSSAKNRQVTQRKVQSKSMSISTSDQGEQSLDYDETGTLTDSYTSEDILSSQSDLLRGSGSRQASRLDQSSDKHKPQQQQQQQQQQKNHQENVTQPNSVTDVSQGARPKKPAPSPKSPITKTARNILGHSRRRETTDSDDESDPTPRAAALRLNSRSKERFSSEEELFKATNKPSSSRTFDGTLNGDIQVKSSNLRSALVASTVTKSKSMTDLPVDDDVDADDRSVDMDARSDNASVGSNNSDKLKALQDEVNALKEIVQQTNSQPFYPYQHMYPEPMPYNELPPPPPPQAPPGHPSQDDFYDPFDDPNALFGGREGFRRRANSFSGRGEREFDEWYWSLPQNRQGTGTEIPLGFAAADAYATQVDNPENLAPRQSRRVAARQRRLQKARMAGKQEQTTVGREGYDSDQSPSRLSQPQIATEQPSRPNYFIPSKFSTDSMRQQMSNRGYFTTPSGAKIYTKNQTSPTNAGQYTGYYGHQPPGRPAGAHGYGPAVNRFASPPTSNVQYGNQIPGPTRSRMQRRYSLGDLQTFPVDGQNYTSAERHYTPARSRSRPPGYGDQMYPNEPLYGNRFHSSPGRPPIGPRQRSKSIATLPQYSPEQGERYFMREEYDSDSDGVASDGGYRRGDRRRRSRKYRKLREDDVSSERRGRVMDYNDGLDEPLRLSRTIEKITNKMMDKVGGELTASMRYGRYGSSIW